MTPIINTLHIAKPWILVVGRERSRMKVSARLVMERDVQAMYSGGPLFVRSETVRLFIQDKLFSTAIVSPKKKYQHYSVRFVKPKSGTIEIRLTKRLNSFA